MNKWESTPKTDDTITRVTFLLDRSLSMMDCRDATIEAFNGYIAGLKSAGDRIRITLIQFDSISFDILYTSHPVVDVPLLTREVYVPRGSTPLIAAAIRAIGSADAESAGHCPCKTVVCIQTDGQENCSEGVTWEHLKSLVDTKTKAGWQFNFMGAGIDAYKQASMMGLSRLQTMSYDKGDAVATANAFMANAINTSAYAAGISRSTQYTVLQKRAAGDKYDPDAKEEAQGG